MYPIIDIIVGSEPNTINPSIAENITSTYENIAISLAGAYL